MIIAFITLLTSMIAAIVGFGGGMLLIAILPFFIAPNLIIPIHGITQLASNSSRMLFSFQNIRWQLLPAFLIGSIFGAVAIGLGLSYLPMEYVPLAIGGYILLNLWSTRFSKFISKYENYYLIGFLQTGLGLVVGATGPLALTVLTKELKSKDEIIATSALFMTISHFAKIPVYLAVTNSLLSNVLLIIWMVVGAVLGSFLGTKVRVEANNEFIIKAIKWLLTLLAIHMICSVLLG